MAMTETAEAKEIPYFIKVAGCNNCKVFKSYTSLSGTEYGHDHELHAMDCANRRLLKPRRLLPVSVSSMITEAG
jgi:hypothetical protein